MAALCDLHTHSYYSDGSFSPSQLLEKACETGISAVALTDHNCVSGLPEFMEAAEAFPVEAVPGVEFSTEYRGVELHILALFVAPEYYPDIKVRLEDFRIRKERSNLELVDRLIAAGIPLDYDTLSRMGKDSYINRAHIAQELTRLGYTASVQEAFKTYLRPGGGFYTPPVRPDAYETIRFIKSIGAVAVLAHPFLNLEEEQLRQFLPEAVSCGLDAMEVLYPKYTPETTALAGKIAEEYGILPSGGSDFHGAAKPDIQLGFGRGELRVPMSVLADLKGRKKL